MPRQFILLLESAALTCCGICAACAVLWACAGITHGLIVTIAVVRTYASVLRRSLKDFAFFFALQFCSYALACWNIRAVANGWIVQLILSDASIAAFQFKVIKKGNYIDDSRSL